MKKCLALLLALTLAAGLLSGCGGSDQPAGSNAPSSNTGSPDASQAPGSETEPVGEPKEEDSFWLSLDPQVSGTMDIMCWSGDGEYHEDIGHETWNPEDLTSRNVAAIYGMAKAFNAHYPNVKINLFAKADDPNGNDTTWAQEMENFKADHGKYPDVYAANDLVGDTAKGLTADLSVYKDDPLYQKLIQPILATMNYYGVQAGLPMSAQPWGIYVNRQLAKDHSITVPEPTWDIDAFTAFLTAADNETFWGTMQMDQLMSILGTGTTTVNAQMAQYAGSGDRVNLASDEVMALLEYVPQWASTEIWTQNGLGNVDQAVMDDGWSWGYRFFCRNYLLTYPGDPWMLSDAAVAQNADGSWPANAVESADWDIYPRPSTPYAGNTVGISADPMAVHNYALDDGDPTLSDSEKASLDLAYAFASFWCGSTEAMQARADQKYSSNGAQVSSLDDSFPVNGDPASFQAQMELWYSAGTHGAYQDKTGFQEVLRLWREAQIWDVSDKCYPYYVMVRDSQTPCLNEWIHICERNVVGVAVSEDNWLEVVKGNLPDWNSVANTRFAESAQPLQDGLKQFYGLTDANF